VGSKILTNQNRNSYQNSSGKKNQINTSGDQILSKFKWEAKSYQKIRAGSPNEIGAGSNILTKIKWEAKS